MSEQIMMDGEPLEVGDRVWCLLRGWGKVIDIHRGFFDYIIVQFGEHEYTYRSEGLPKLSGVFQQVRTLYWDEIKIAPPPKLKKKKVWDWFAQNSLGTIWRINGVSKDVIESSTSIVFYQKIDGTEREVER